MQPFSVKKLLPGEGPLRIDVPASKSILNRALILAAFAKGDVTLSCGEFADDTFALLDCLTQLGIHTERTEKGLRVHGCGGNIPNRLAALNVRSAGTAARFLTTVLAFLGGDYDMSASEQMSGRPMEILPVLERAGVRFEYLNETHHFPFRMHSRGIEPQQLTVDTDLSTQYASGILLAAACKRPVSLHLTGQRTEGSYIRMTLEMLRSFGATWQRKENVISVLPMRCTPSAYEIEADLSGACYFYALALLFKTRILVRHVRMDSLQGDAMFLRLLQEKGVKFYETADGLAADGRSIASFSGFQVNMRDFSDQALTVAALAPFATTQTRITGIGHIRFQECDRIRAMEENLHLLGVCARADDDGITIEPASSIEPATIKTFGDHRVAMAFSLVGLKTGTLTIDDPKCCEKTFASFFDILTELTRQS